MFWVEGGIVLESPEHAAMATGCEARNIVAVCDGLQTRSQAGIHGPEAHFRWDEPELDPPQDLFLDEDPVRRRLQRIRLELHDVVGPRRFQELDGTIGGGLRVLNGLHPERNDPVLDGLLRESAALMTDLFKSEVPEVVFEKDEKGPRRVYRSPIGHMLVSRRGADRRRGRPVTQADLDEVLRLRADGMHFRDVAARLGLPIGMVKQIALGGYVLTPELERLAVEEGRLLEEREKAAQSAAAPIPIRR